MKYLCAVLVGEPFLLSLDYIKTLTLEQISGIYFHPRDKYGSPIKQEKFDPKNPPAVTYKEMFFRSWFKRGMPDSVVRAKWLEWLKDNPEADPETGLFPAGGKEED